MIVNSSSMKCEGIDTMFLMVLGADELATFANNLALSVTTSPEFYDAREAKLSALSETGGRRSCASQGCCRPPSIVLDTKCRQRRRSQKTKCPDRCAAREHFSRSTRTLRH
jgi:hypothetical protein